MKRKKGEVFVLITALFFSCGKSNKTEQNNMTRVEMAYQECFDLLGIKLREKKISMENVNVFIRAFKKEEILEVWAKNKSDDFFEKINEYSFCASSGTLGPKRKEGDKQIPEGFYHINRFNPQSKFHLSLGLNYPNDSDLIWGDPEEPGGDVFIHGGCSTVGCIPLTDEKIKEVYVLAAEARKNGQLSIPVHIFPFKMTEANLDQYGPQHSQHVAFWKDLQPGFLYFEKHKKCPLFMVLSNGHYQMH